MRRAAFLAACAILAVSDGVLGWHVLTGDGGAVLPPPSPVAPSVTMTTAASATCNPVGVFTTDPRNGRTIITVVCRP